MLQAYVAPLQSSPIKQHVSFAMANEAFGRLAIHGVCSAGGRRYHSTLRVRRQLGGKTVGVSTRRRGQSNEKPTACCAIDNNTVAIC